MKNIKKMLSIILVFCMTFSLTACQKKAPETTDRIELAIFYTGEYLADEMKNPNIEDGLMVTSLLRSMHVKFDDSISDKYTETVYETLLNNNGTLGDLSLEEYPEVMLAYTSTGKLVNEDEYGYGNLIYSLNYDSEILRGGYLNKIRTLTAIESGHYNINEDGDITVESLVEFILDLQEEDGSFQYKGMQETPIEITANSVIALSLTEKTQETQTAIESGVKYLSTRIRNDDSLKDLALTVAALNTAGVDATDLEGNDLISWIMEYEREDFSYNQNQPDAKDGDLQDTAYALMAFSSQYRFENDLNSFYDMSDVILEVKNSDRSLLDVFMSPLFLILGVILLIVILVLFIKIKKTKKLKAEGIYNEAESREMTDEEIIQRDIKESKLEDENTP